MNNKKTDKNFITEYEKLCNKYKLFIDDRGYGRIYIARVVGKNKRFRKMFFEAYLRNSIDRILSRQVDFNSDPLEE